MKKIVFAAFFVLSGSLFASQSEVQRVLKKFESLGAVHLPSAVEYRIYDPFRRVAPLVKKRVLKPVSTAPRPIVVTAVMNDRVFVNGRWLRVGDRIGRYSITGINGSGVVLKSGGTTRFVPLGRKKSILHIKEDLQ